MSQALRYTPSLKPGLMIEDAEGKWAKYEVLAQVVAQCDALQQRLTAAGERADVLVDLLTHAHIAIHTMEPGFFLLEKIDAALKPAEAARCTNCDRATVEQCDDAGCGFLGAGNGAPE